MKYELLIFDWDGTLADSVGQIVATMQKAITALALPPRSDFQLAELVGLGFATGLQQLFPEFDERKLLELMLEYRRQAPTVAYTAPLFDGAAETLQLLSGHGYRMAVATGKSREGLVRSLATHQHIEPLFEMTRCADESADKPDPLMLTQILEALQIAPGAALMIGDTEYDMSMAAALGMPAVGVTTGVHDNQRLRKAGARAVLSDVRALPQWLTSAST